MRYLFILSGLIAFCLNATLLPAQDHEIYVFDTLDISVHELHSSYQPSARRWVDIDHVALDLVPDFPNKQLAGSAVITFSAYNHPVDFLELDAKGMTIGKVALLDDGRPVERPYTYDLEKLRIDLGRPVTSEEKVSVQIDYIAEPYGLAEKGLSYSAGHGLYFIDPEDHNPAKPVQMWTQGETNANSIWFPVVDAPNEQFTQEIYLTVPETYITLSNGLLLDAEKLGDGMRKDHWHQSRPHGPHLAMIAAGEFFRYESEWNGLPMNFYTDPAYSSSVHHIFASTPAILDFYSELFGVPYPWEKYDQMVVHDYMSGAMENTTAVIFYYGYFADSIDMLDFEFEETIAHEIAHQWFGNLVACESWAHLTLNESFATYAEYLWFEHANGREYADQLLHDYLYSYLNEFVYKSQPIVQYHYDDAENLFDAHRYEKGSWVLHMLRDYLGDEDFFAGLTLYLNRHAFQSAEIHDLRIDMEDVSGLDLHWFFDQWFMNAGHPVVRIGHDYDPSTGETIVSVEQVQDIGRYPTFRFPLSIDVYLQDSIYRTEVWIDQRRETFRFQLGEAPDLVNVDAKKIMLWDKEEDLPVDQWMVLYREGPLFTDRIEAISGLVHEQWDKEVRAVFLEALNDRNAEIRRFALSQLLPDQYHAGEGLRRALLSLSLNDENSEVKRLALYNLSTIDLAGALQLADTLLQHDPSRMVKAAALSLHFEEDPKKAYRLAREHAGTRSILLKRTISEIYAAEGRASDHDFFRQLIYRIPFRYAQEVMGDYMAYLQRMDVKVLQEAAQFLLGIAVHEESSDTRSAASNALYDLNEYFLRSNQAGSTQKRAVLKKAIDEL